MLMLKDDNFEQKTMNDSSSLLSNINNSNNNVDFEKTKNIFNEFNDNDNNNYNDNNNDYDDNNINLNINDYTKEDLYNILELENPNSNDIKVKIDLLKNTLFKKNNNVKEFLSNVEEKLLQEEESTIEEFANLILYKEDNNKQYDFENKTMIDSTSLLKNLNDNDNNNDFEKTKNILNEINQDEDEDEDEDNNINLNLNINDYTKEDLYNILELDNPSSNEIKIKIDSLKNTSFKEKNNVKKFLSDVEDKLLEETNYIEQFSNLDLYKENNIIENYYDLENEEDNYEIENNEDNVDYENNIDNEDNEYNLDNINNVDNENNENNEDNKELKDIQNNNITNNISNELSVVNNTNHYYYHFNTKYRDNNILSKSTNCEFTIPQTNNVVELRLGSVHNLKKPFLINEEKNNNKFCIKIYKTNSNIEEKIITLDEGYYEILNELQYEINEKLKDISFISYNIKKNNKSEFILNNDNDIIHIEIDFTKYYAEPYSFENILGFKNKIYKIIPNEKIISEKLINNTDNNLFFCLDEYQSNIIETHQLLAKNNIINNKVLARINSRSGNITNNYTINENFSNTVTRIDGIRKYNGLTNLLKLKIKIIDSYNNIIESHNDYMFTLEFIIAEKMLSKN